MEHSHLSEQDGATATGGPVLRVEGLRLARAGREILRGIHISVQRGERLVLMGLSGGGKTTVLRAIVALEGFQQGRIEVDGFALTPGPPPPESRLRPLRHRVGMVFQEHALFEHLTALANVMLAPLHVHRRGRDSAEQRARELLVELRVGHRADAFPRQLSGGEAQRVAIARALAVDPPLLLMDEPTAALDPARRRELAALLAELADAGRTLVISTHDVDFARQLASRVAVLAEGHIVEIGSPEELLEHPRHAATRQLLAAD
jgi:ABC-type polar amino acid transport system ATPase subunit